MKNKRKWAATLGALLFLLGGWRTARAEETTDPQVSCTITDGAGTSQWMLGDGNRTTKLQWQGGSLTVEGERDFSSLYIIWDRPPGRWQGEAGESSFSGGENGFIHEYVPLAAPVRQCVLELPEGAVCCDIYAFGEGELPDWVQRWEPPLEDADLLLLPTHADDEHLYFGGTMPYYAGELGKKVQVAYFTNHWWEPYRPHELLNGLWTVGVRAYPVMSDFADQYAGSLQEAQALYDEKEAVAWQVEQLRRFKPEVVVGHDVDGEYGHGVHIYNTYTLRQALELSGDPEQYPDSAQRWGAWDVPKTYLHLYPENPVVMDWSVPLEAFGGRTALEMARQGFEKHVSQQTYFMVEDSGPYDCRLFGLYRSTVGPDQAGGDFFEGLEPEDYSDYQPPEPEPEPVSEPDAPAPAPEAEPSREETETSPLWLAAGAAAAAVVLLAAVIGCRIKRKRRSKG
jgi:LmbE family N-acetylglucosaminyl deacetylase